MQPRPKQGVSLQFWAHLASLQTPSVRQFTWLWGPSAPQGAAPIKATVANSKAPKGCKPDPSAPALFAAVVGWCLPPLAPLMQPPLSVCYHFLLLPCPRRGFKSCSAGRPWCRKEGCWALWGGMAHPCSQQVLSPHPVRRAHLLHCCTNSFLLMVFFSSTPAHRGKQFTLANGDAHNQCTKQQRHSACSLPILLSNAPSLIKLLIRDY